VFEDRSKKTTGETKLKSKTLVEIRPTSDCEIDVGKFVKALRIKMEAKGTTSVLEIHRLVDFALSEACDEDFMRQFFTSRARSHNV